MWRLLLSYFYGKVRLKRNKTPKVNQPVGVVAGRGSAEVVHHSEDPPLTRDDGTDVSDYSSALVIFSKSFSNLLLLFAFLWPVESSSW